MDYERVRNFFFRVGVGIGIGLVLLCMVSHLTGCQQGDQPIADVNQVASAARQLLDSPAGQALPPPIGLYGGIATTLIMGGAAAYKQWRLSQMSKATKAIVRGIEASDQKNEANPKSPVKAAIAVEMRKLGVYDAGNKLVDRLKVS